jgi:hypothetical protein
MTLSNRIVGLATVLLLAGGGTLNAQAGPVKSKKTQLISESAMLSGLPAGALFPFLDVTPNSLVRAHIAVTDAASSCAAGAAAPSNIQVLVGEAGVALVNVLTAATNTGISSPAGQCVFHVTISPGQNGVPSNVTDIVVLNAGASALTGIHTVTASAHVNVPKPGND